MKIKDLIEELQKYDPEADLYGGDYYYDIKEGYSPIREFRWISTEELYRPVEGNVVYIDTNQYPTPLEEK